MPEERGGVDRHAEHRQGGHRGGHARQVRGCLPAPAMTISNPSFSAFLAKAMRRSGVRCAETIRAS